MRRRVYAHTPNDNGDWHLLADHLHGTAERAAAFAEPFGAAEIARTVGWLHDAGKCSDRFCAYLEACHAEGNDQAKATFRSRDHKRPGALRAREIGGSLGPLLAAMVLGHHGGIPDLTEVRGSIEQAATDPVVAATLKRFDDEIGASPLSLAPIPPAWVTNPPGDRVSQRAFQRDVELFMRLVFSAIVDADFLDTEAHFHTGVSDLRAPDRTLDGLFERLEHRRRQLLADAPATAVNCARSEMYEAVLARADADPGLYSLAAPTGAGKTQMGLAWALKHAAINGLRRVVTAVPFITVTDQVAEVYRHLLDADGDRVVVEHHSQVGADDLWQKLASENWDSPVVVTTTVRLFESLFSNRPSACRRLHRLARSVIVLDEVQGIPVEVLEPVVDVLRSLVDRLGASVLIMTATPPTLEHITPTHGRPATPLLSDLRQWSGPFRRTVVVRSPRLTHEQVGEVVAGQHQCLCIVNTITDAQQITAAVGAEIIHLSTRLRPVDRRERLGEIRLRLADRDVCRVVSTQLVEAGVDLDFPSVMRAMAPLPSLAQADGRCNRHGHIQGSLGTTTLFQLEGGKLPRGAYYRVGTDHTEVILDRPGADVRDLPTIEEWYRRFLQDPSVRMDKHDVQGRRETFAYEATADAFRMIDDDQVSVAVEWPPTDQRAARVHETLQAMLGRRPVTRHQARALQDVVVSIPRWQANQALSRGVLTEVNEHLLCSHDSRNYDPVLGLTLQAPPMEALLW